MIDQEPRFHGIAAFAIRNAHFTIVTFIILTIMGILGLVMMPKDLLPAANLPAVQILSFYAGMPVEHVEQDLTYLFERYTGQAVGIKSQESRSLVGVSVVKNYFNSSIELSNAIAQTGSLVMSVMRKLPPGSQPPLILPFDPMASVPLALCAVSGENKKQSELQDIGRYWVANAIQGVQGAMAPTVMGGTTRQVVIFLDPKKLEYFNFSPIQVLSKLTSMNTFVPAGDVKIGKYDLQITTNGLVERIEDINNWYLRSQQGVPVRLNQVGRAEDSHAIQTNVVLINGKPEVYVPIYRQPGANSLEIMDQIRESLKKLESTLHGFKLRIVSDQSIFIRKAIESISHEAMIGGGLAALLVLFFLGSLRSTFAVMLSLPLSLLSCFAFLKVLGQSLNVMTLGGIALSVGVLVDNSIVVIENISKKFSQGMSAQDASMDGAQEVAMPVLASTLSTLVVFFPVLFLTDVVKILFSALSLSVMSAMIASYFSAMMIIPLYTTHFLKKTQPSEKSILTWIQDKIEGATQGYGRLLNWTIQKRNIILPLTLFSLVLIGGLFSRKIGTELFPRADAGSFQIDLRGPTAMRIEETTALAKKIESKLRDYISPHDLEMIITNAGVYYGYPAAFTPNSGTQDVFFNVQLTNDREHSSQHYAKVMREQLPKDFPEVEFGIELGGLLTSALNGGLRSPIDVQISGSQAKIAHQYATQIVDLIKKVRGAVDVRIQQRFDAPEIKLNIDREKSNELGLTPDEIIKNVISATSNSSNYNPAIWVDPKTGIDYFFGVQFSEKDITSIEQFLNIPVTSQRQNRSVPLNRVASTQMTKGPIELNHMDLQPVIDIYLDAQDRDIAGVARDVQKVLKHHRPPEGYTANIRGEISEMKKSVGSLGGGFLLSAVLVYLILVIQFRSFILPAIIMTIVPIAMVGVIIMMRVTGTYFSIQAAIGCIFVIGIAVANGVLLIEYILDRSKEEADLDQAIITGAKARLRPITMTALASMFGLLPMAIGIGHGSEANIPLGRAVIGGQLLATLLNFFVVPILFRMLFKYLKIIPKTH